MIKPNQIQLKLGSVKLDKSAETQQQQQRNTT